MFVPLNLNRYLQCWAFKPQFLVKTLILEDPVNVQVSYLKKLSSLSPLTEISWLEKLAVREQIPGVKNKPKAYVEQRRGNSSGDGGSVVEDRLRREWDLDRGQRQTISTQAALAQSQGCLARFWARIGQVLSLPAAQASGLPSRSISPQSSCLFLSLSWIPAVFISTSHCFGI